MSSLPIWPVTTTQAGDQVRPGDVFVVRNKKSCIQHLQRVGTDSSWDHVAVLYGIDTEGRWRVIEGKPGGVGWGDAGKYLTDPWTLSTGAQPKTDDQRTKMLATMVELLKTDYSWWAIFGDFVDEVDVLAFGKQIDKIWRIKYGPNETPPGHFVCSSVAAWASVQIGLDAPNRGELTKPFDWAQFILDSKHNWTIA